MSKARDMSDREFRDALKRRGFAIGAIGYVSLPEPLNNISVSMLNSPDQSLRGILKWLIAAEKKHSRS